MGRIDDYILVAVRREVADRAGFMCEYCLLADDAASSFYKHQVDHIISLKHRGTNDLNNLAYACFSCNAFKGPDVGSIHDETDEFIRLFNPRIDGWTDHFWLKNSRIEPKTPIGWVTATLLQFNAPARVQIRRLTI